MASAEASNTEFTSLKQKYCVLVIWSTNAILEFAKPNRSRSERQLSWLRPYSGRTALQSWVPKVENFKKLISEVDGEGVAEVSAVEGEASVG
ncbi:MAG: hypothetical protein ACKESB_03160 [Candidatus Hodgkinia cicadicola]